MTDQRLQPESATVMPTAFTKLVGCRVPVQLAAMGGGVTTPELAAAVSRAGGLGMLQRNDSRPLADRISELEQDGAGPYGVNFVLHSFGRADHADVELAASHARLVEFFWGDPDDRLVAMVHSGGAIASWQIGSVDEAQRAVDAGCEMVVAQGVEAGGHVRGTTGLLPLLAGVLDAVDVPVLAAGGIATARSMAAVLAAGAAGVRVGTRFLATVESGAHPGYVSALLTADGDATVLTEAFSVGWPEAPHRVLRSAVAAAEAFDSPIVGTVQNPAGAVNLPRLAARTPSREVRGTIAAMALYAGQGVGQITQVMPASQVVAELTEGAQRLLERWHTGVNGG